MKTLIATPDPDEPNNAADLVLTESRTMRAQTIGRVDVLDKVKALALLPDGVHATTEIVAAYYEVPLTTIESVVEGNRDELAANGRRVLRGSELREFAAPYGGAANLGLHHNTRSLADFSRRAVLNVGQLLTESSVAKQVRTYLLDVEATPSPFTIPTTFAGALALAAQQAAELEETRTEVAELVATNAKLSPRARVADKYEANPGVNPTVFHKTHFTAVPERDFFEHLYRKDYLIDQRNSRWDERNGEWKDGPEHRHPTAKGKRYFYLAPKLDRRGVRRQQTLVIPGDAEHDLVAALERDGLPSRNRPALPGSQVTQLPRRPLGGAA
ncbi:hypothetical protein [Streptomyces parvus]|uniref:hypothetical protein n=1 Tax=Streptomyces parvus TaxID=66428 RepID=UPI002100B893|nr:hypothetical protein [Streptomyces parvus]MCQ1575451.1 hypothetical protein [Streptomyces parvus]